MTTPANDSGNPGGTTTPPAAGSTPDPAKGSQPDPASPGGEAGQQGSSEGGGSGSLDLSSLPENAQKYIKDLRGESAKYRNRAKTLETDMSGLNTTLAGVKKAFGIDDGEELTTDDFDTLQQEKSVADFQTAVLSEAIEHGVPKAGLDFFSFKIQQATGALEEGEELSSEDVAAIANEVRATVGGGSVNTSVSSGTGGSQNPSAVPETGGVDLDRFVNMTTTEKSELYTKNPDLYTKLVTDAKQNRRLVG